MSMIFCKGIKTEDDLKNIYELDKEAYSSTYLLDYDQYLKRIKKNPETFYILKNSSNCIMGYVSLIPIDEKTYARIKNGEIDKDVITEDSILTKKDNPELIYLDSIIIGKKYRKNKLSHYLLHNALKELRKDYPNTKKLLARTISKGGKAVVEKISMNVVKRIDKDVYIFERILKTMK